MSMIGAFGAISRRTTTHRGGTSLLSLSKSVLLFHSHSANPSQPTLSRKQSNSGVQGSVDLVNRMVQMRPLPPISRFTKVLGTITKMGHYETTLSLIRKLKFLGIEVNVYTLTIATNCYCRLHRVDYGLSLLGSLFKSGCAPNIVTLTTLIKGLISNNRAPDAEELFKKLLRDREIEPNVGKTTIAIRLLRMMEEGSCQPNTVLYNIIVDGLCKDGLVDDALDLLTEMNEKGILANVVAYNSLLRGLCNFGHWKKAARILTEILGFRISPSVVTFNVLLDALTKEGRMKEVKKVLKIMIDQRVCPDVVTYNVLMDGYCLCGKIDEVMRLFSAIGGNGIDSDVLSYNILINGYCKKKKMDDAIHLFREMSQRGLEPSIGTYIIVLQGLFFIGKCHTTRELLNEMLAMGLIPNIHTCELTRVFLVIIF